MPLLGFIVFFALFFAGLLFIMYRVLSAHTRQTTDHLTGLNEDYLQRRDEIKKLYEENQEQSRNMAEQAVKDAEKIKKQALEDAEVLKAKAIDEAYQKSERLIKDAMQARDALKNELVQKMESRSIERACELVREILSNELCKETHQFWVNELISKGLSNIGDVQIPRDAKAAKIVSAFPLTGPQKNKINERISSLLGEAVTAEEEVDPGIVAGLRIHIGHLIIDGTLASKLREAAQHAQNATESN